MPTEERRRAYTCDVTYGTAKQIGFDFLRSSVAYSPEDQLLRPFYAAIIDEADALLIDEARVPMVIAGVLDAPPRDLHDLADLVKELEPEVDYEIDERGDTVTLTEEGVERCQSWLRCENLHTSENLELLTALNCALHAQALLRCDVDYIVRKGHIELVDELTGRIISDRHWPYGLQTALEAKEGLSLHPEGTILGSVTIHHFVECYRWIAGMTGTARPAADELKETYDLDTVVIPTHRPSIRVDHPDRTYATHGAKAQDLVQEITRIHATGRPILVGTRTVEESEALAAHLVDEGVPVRVLNARNDEMEASIIADAGCLGAVTIATNMAGRGTDIGLGGADEKDRKGVVALGGLYVIGTNRHESRRIDNQLRGRAGRQGDPGSTRFIISLEDELMRRHNVAKEVPKSIRSSRGDQPFEQTVVNKLITKAQRIIEGQHFTIRHRLRAFSELLELQRQQVQDYRNELLRCGEKPAPADELLVERFERLGESLGSRRLGDIRRRLTILQLDEQWAEHLERATEVRETIFLQLLAGKDPLTEHDRWIAQFFESFFERVEEGVDKELEKLELSQEVQDFDDSRLRGPTSTWTYLVDDHPFRPHFGQALTGNAGFAAWVALIFWPFLLVWALVGLFTAKRTMHPKETDD